jgi:hypothetical protein
MSPFIAFGNLFREIISQKPEEKQIEELTGRQGRPPFYRETVDNKAFDFSVKIQLESRPCYFQITTASRFFE